MAHIRQTARVVSFVILFIIVLSVKSEENKKKLIMNFNYSCQEPSKINIKLINNSERSIFIPENRLPWSLSSPSIKMKAFLIEKGKFKPLEEWLSIADYFRDIEIPAHVFIEGNLDINYRLNDVDDVRNKGNVIVLIDVLIKNTLGDSVANANVIYFMPERKYFFTECPALLVNP